MEKLLPTQLNRPPAGVQRPPDPNRFANIDVTPSSGQHDPQYQQMVSDIEALQQRHGWLAGRGAFDKDDLLYLRDKEREQHQQEQRKRDAEAAAFAAARALAEQQQEQRTAAKLRQPESLRQEPARSQGSITVARLGVVTVKHHKPKNQQPTQPAAATTTDIQQQQQQPQQPQQQLKQLQHHGQHRERLEEAAGYAVQQATKKRRVGSPDVEDSQHSAGKLPDSQGPGPRPAPGATGATVPPAALEGLLAGYGSDDPDSDEDRGKQQQQDQQQGGNQPASKLQLPSAAELLQSDLRSSFQQAPVGAEAEPAVLHVGVATSSKDTVREAWV